MLADVWSGFAESELTVAWSWVLVGIALSQVIGGPIAAGMPILSSIVIVNDACLSWLLVLRSEQY